MSEAIGHNHSIKFVPINLFRCFVEPMSYTWYVYRIRHTLLGVLYTNYMLYFESTCTLPFLPDSKHHRGHWQSSFFLSLVTAMRLFFLVCAWITLVVSHGLHSNGVFTYDSLFLPCTPLGRVLYYNSWKKLCMTVFSAMYSVAGFAASRVRHHDAVFKNLLCIGWYLACLASVMFLFGSLVCSSSISLLFVDLKL